MATKKTKAPKFNVEPTLKWIAFLSEAEQWSSEEIETAKKGMNAHKIPPEIRAQYTDKAWKQVKSFTVKVTADNQFVWVRFNDGTVDKFTRYSRNPAHPDWSTRERVSHPTK